MDTARKTAADGAIAVASPPAAPGVENVLPLRAGLEAEGLVKRYRRREVVSGVSVRIGPGEIVGLLGPNGAGKTTSFYCILGLVPSDQGRVMLDGREITGLPMYLRARGGVGYL